MPVKRQEPTKIAELARQIMRWKRTYYAGNPEVSDQVYDRAEDELRRLAPDHPALQVVGAGGITQARSAKVEHRVPMLSLEKTYEISDLESWIDGHPVLGTIKVDGNSLSLIWTDGVLTCAKTRGDGRVGEDVTDKARWVAAIPTRLDGKNLPAEVEVRGEMFCTESSFVQLALEMERLGLERPTSPRNIVAGLLGRKTHFELARWFDFFAFEIIQAEELGLKTEAEKFRWLEDAGFKLPFHRLLKNSDQVRDFLEEARAQMEDGEIGLDGAVFTFDDLALHRELGVTSHHPRWKLSFKWPGETGQSVIQDITWSTSRLGFVTPVAVIKPIPLSGAMITNITLHNAAHVKTYNIKPGDEIEIIRSGEVIPKFLRVVKAAPGQCQLPTRCPECDAQLVMQEVKLQCPNAEGCPAQKLRSILNWIKCAEIEDLSEKRLAALVDKGLVRSIADLYRLSADDLMQIPNTREKMAAKLLANINKSRLLPLASFLNGLGIEGAGLTTWEAIVGAAPTLEKVLALGQDAIMQLDGFAEKSASQIVSGLKARGAIIDELLQLGVKPMTSAPPAGSNGAGSNGALAGRVFVITGALSRPRDEFEKMLKAAGASVSSSVSKNTWAVVTNDPTSASSKMKKARELGIKVWNEDDLIQELEKRSP